MDPSPTFCLHLTYQRVTSGKVRPCSLTCSSTCKRSGQKGRRHRHRGLLGSGSEPTTRQGTFCDLERFEYGPGRSPRSILRWILLLVSV